MDIPAGQRQSLGSAVQTARECRHRKHGKREKGGGNTVFSCYDEELRSQERGGRERIVVTAHTSTDTATLDSTAR